MAQSADKFSVSGGPNFPGQVEPPKPMQGPYEVSEGLEVLRFPWLDREVLISKQFIREVYRNVQEHAVNTFTYLAWASSDITKSARTRVERVQREHPLQLLAVIGGTALVFGAVARVWRSRRHA